MFRLLTLISSWATCGFERADAEDKEAIEAKERAGQKVSSKILFFLEIQNDLGETYFGFGEDSSASVTVSRFENLVSTGNRGSLF